MRAEILALLMGIVAPAVSQAASLTALRTLPAGTVIAEDDLALSPAAVGGIEDPAAAIGRQARTTIYEGRPLLAANLTNPTLVERNALVTVLYTRDGLSISTEGRALGRGGAGETIRVLNIASRVTLTATVNPDGTLSVVTRP
ncbi:flagella basal body P-ring formation protein FlgA [Paracoccus suum]|uniref:Flagella basal body P-ring formation protein FlgA n=1 Tax=Paracoccus suum TaxID=2259340 RepID=A0A344PGR7_9RHOB|nr:flagellar basal body P-ring formation chaperone FlgA [Paracoccus suum]AXC48572.1 flagella basal body P-ring formation protein FlgA [Paracoccus suum]